MRNLLILLAAVSFFPLASLAAAPTDVPATGVVTMIDLGSKSCIPCKMMAPILDEVEKEYAGKAAIVFIDVRDNPGESGRFGLRAIPTQIFFDKQGNEVFRHEGFFDKKSISGVLDKLLAQ